MPGEEPSHALEVFRKCLDLILPLVDSDSKRVLRGVCEDARNAVDSRTRKLTWDGQQ
eukprot:gene12284-15436_t